MDKIIYFNVGGRSFAIGKEFIDKYPETLLYVLIRKESSLKDNNGMFFIDRNPDLFSFILDFYRQDKIIYPTIVEKEVFDIELDYFLIKCLSTNKNIDNIVIDNQTIINGLIVGVLLSHYMEIK